MKKTRTENPDGWVHPDPKGWRLVPDDQIDPKDAVILWFYDEQFRVHRVHVMALEEYQRRNIRELHGSLGAVCSDWLNYDWNGIHYPGDSNPAGVFGKLATFYGFSDKYAAQSAILEFAKLKGEVWAQRMAMVIPDDYIQSQRKSA